MRISRGRLGNKTEESMRRLGAFERRNETRYACEPRYVEVRWLAGGEAALCRGYLADLSLNGASCMLEEALPQGRLCRMEIRLSKFGGLEVGTVSVGARVASRIEREGKWLTGFEFESVPPADMERIRRAVNVLQAEIRRNANY